MKRILLIVIGLSSVLLADFSKTGNIVTDAVTGLQWQDDAVDSSMRWGNAITYCESLDLGGHNNWRLPNINELKSIIDRSKENPAIVDGFENINSSNYWSSTTVKNDQKNAWIVLFSKGYVRRKGKGGGAYVKCVREGG